MAAAVRREQTQLTDTIFAVSSGRPPAAIAVIRVSGPDAFTAVQALAGPLPRPRRASLRTLRLDGAPLDSALVLVFPAPHSSTGEDLAELHCHGGRAVIAAVESALARQDGLRRADPGEFTRRALTNGRIDLMEAEGLADLLEAETDAQRIAAMAAAEGRLSARTGDWLRRLTALAARLEAQIDYSDEDDVAADAAVVTSIHADVARLRTEMKQALDAPSVERLHEGVRVVIAGPPNAGKSTLLNLLVEREAAIVSSVAGTTRDRVEAPVLRGGLPLVLVDTAGLTATSDPVEAIGVERAQDAMSQADLILWLGDEPPPRTDALWLHARADLPSRTLCPPGPVLAISATDASSIAAVWTLLAQRAAGLLVTSDAVPAMREHQRIICHQAAEALTPADDLVFLADGVAYARRLLSRLLGQDATEQMLDTLFSRFCVGK